jgi:hypothetical protein
VRLSKVIFTRLFSQIMNRRLRIFLNDPGLLTMSHHLAISSQFSLVGQVLSNCSLILNCFRRRRKHTLATMEFLCYAAFCRSFTLCNVFKMKEENSEILT